MDQINSTNLKLNLKQSPIFLLPKGESIYNVQKFTEVIQCEYLMIQLIGGVVLIMRARK